MKLTNKIIDILANTIMHKVTEAKANYKSTDEYKALVEAKKSEYDYDDLSKEHDEIEAMRIEIDSLNKVINNKISELSRSMRAAGLSFSTYSLDIKTSTLDKTIANTIVINDKFPSRDEVLSSIIFAEDADVGTLQANVLAKYNL